MKCHSCKGNLKRGKTTYTANRHGYHLLIDEVPAWVCTQCGESFYEEEEVETIQSMLREVDAGALKVRKETAKRVPA